MHCREWILERSVQVSTQKEMLFTVQYIFTIAFIIMKVEEWVENAE